MTYEILTRMIADAKAEVQSWSEKERLGFVLQGPNPHKTVDMVRAHG